MKVEAKDMEPSESERGKEVFFPRAFRRRITLPTP